MPADLCTLSDTKALAGKSAVAGDDAVWSALITSASDFIRVYTGRDYAALTYSEIRNGSGGTELFLRDGPATSITSLAVCGIAIPAQPADGQPGYFLDDTGNVLCLSFYRFIRGRKNVRVTYAAGSATIPPAIAQACKEIVCWAKSRGPRADQSTQSLGPDGAQTFAWSMADLPATAKLILDQARRVASP